MEPTPQPLTLRNVLDVFRRQRGGMVVILIMSLMLGAAVVATTRPLWRSKTALLVDAPTSNMALQNPNDPVNEVSLPNQPTDLVTQAAILQSNSILFDTFKLAGLDTSRFNGLNPEQLAQVIPAVKVDPVANTSIVEVSVDTHSQDECLKVAKTLPEVYKTFLQSTRQTEVKNALNFLKTRLGEQSAKLKADETKLNAFKQARKLIFLENEGATRSQLASNAKTEQARAESELAAAKERLNSLLKDQMAIPDSRRTESSQANTALIESQKNQIATLTAKRDQLLNRYLPDRDEVREAEAELAEAKRRLEEMPADADTSVDTRPQVFYSLEDRIAAARSDVKAAQAQVHKVSNWSRQTEQELLAYNSIALDQDELARAVEEDKASITAINRASEELGLRRNSARDPVTVLMEATVPQQVMPKIPQTMAIAVLLGLFMSLGFALVKDGMDDRIASSDEIPFLAGIPALGDVVAVPRRLPALAAEKFNARLLDSYRILRFNLGLAGDDPARSLLVTSTMAREGKSDVAFNLAKVSASEASTVILVDANLRNPSLHNRLGSREIPGLADILAGKATLAESLQTTAIPGMSIVTGGTTAEYPADLLESARMKTLMEELTGAAKLVVFDAPATLGVADARILSGLTEATLYVARAGRSRRAGVREGIEALRQAGAKLAGMATVTGRPSKA